MYKKEKKNVQFTSSGVVDTSLPLCLFVKVVDCLMGEKCLVVDGVYTCLTCIPGDGEVCILHSAVKKNKCHT